MTKNLVNLALTLCILVIITACVCKGDRDNPANIRSNSTASSTPSTPRSPSSGDKNDVGDFLVEHEDVKDSKYVEIDRQIRTEKLLEKAADKLNAALILPHDITLKSAECGKINAFYDPDGPSVTVCFELMEQFYQTFRAGGDSGDKAYHEMFDAVRFVFLHEIGHALIDTYSLPITANEEDAADRCSAYINIEELGQDGIDAVLAAAKSFKIGSKNGPGQRDLADEHLLQEQRFYNSLCMLYGSDPEKYSSNQLIKGYLPKERADRCQSEYQRTRDSWTTLLEPWRKK